MSAQSRSFLGMAETTRDRSWSKSKMLIAAGAALAACGAGVYFTTRILPSLLLKAGRVVVVKAGPLKGKRGVCLGNSTDGLIRVLLDGGKCIICFPKQSLQSTRAYADPARRLLELDEELAAAPPQGQLRVVVAGLMGSGKSTLCRMLAYLLGGTWINQDEFSSKGKGSKKAFLAEIKRVSADPAVPVLIVDKINTMRQHRREILEAMEGGGNGHIVFVQLFHPQDREGSFDNQVKLCVSRIQGRGENHRTLMGDDPKLKSILAMTVKGAERMQEDEANRFSGHFQVDMTAPSKTSLMSLLSELGNAGFLRGFDVELLTTQSRVNDAFSITQAAEQDLRQQKDAPAKQKDTKDKGVEEGTKQNGDKKKQKKSKQNNQASEDAPDDASQQTGQKSKPKQPPQVMLWAVDFESEALDAIRALWKTQASSAPDLHMQDTFHSTLIYIGGKSDEDVASQYWHVQSTEEVTKLRETLEAREGEDVELELTDLVWDDCIAAAAVSGLHDICLNRYAHVTLALKAGTPPVKSNELLARRATNADFQAGVGHWLQALGLRGYLDSVRTWCESSGVSTADELARRAAEFVAALENEDQDQRLRIQEILSRAAPGDIHEARAGVKLCGKVHAWRRRK